MKKIPAGRRTLWSCQALISAVIRWVHPLLAVAAWIWRRLLFRTTFIAITGSAGKTTCSECLASVLSSGGRVFWAHYGPVGCWKDYCEKRMICDDCWELDAPLDVTVEV